MKLGRKQMEEQKQIEISESVHSFVKDSTM